jgi:2-dehydro-3-deoxy-D-arabinonate dehydratase
MKKLHRSIDALYLETETGWALLPEESIDTLFTADVPAEFVSAAKPLRGKPDFQPLAPLGSQEVWAAGVTYLRSRNARMEESREAGGADCYDRVYEAERPELFFKAPAYRVVDPNGAVRIRRDSHWSVPEPELTLALNSQGRVIGYTVGNDMSSRDIEGENPLYLPQAKIYDGSCSLGPCIVLTDEPLDPATEILLRVFRDEKTILDTGTVISQIKRSFDDLAGYLFRETSFKTGCFLMTGTGIVPPNDFSLQPGDRTEIEITDIGILSNTVA